MRRFSNRSSQWLRPYLVVAAFPAAPVPSFFCAFF
jgi:hypothetical protein